MAILASALINSIAQGNYDARLVDLYQDEALLTLQKDRYAQAVKNFIELFGDREVEIYSAPGRTEIGGNHTDHQYGAVLAASVNIDTIAVVAPAENNMVYLKSEGYKQMEVDLNDLAINEADFGTTKALICGVANGLKKRGFNIGGFYAYATSQVLSGSGLSSSAAFEVLVGNIIAGLYNDAEAAEPVRLAQISQEAENQYFGKPCGLMDQMASSVGNLINIDFKDPSAPIIRKVDVDFGAFGYSLCIVDTKGSHADLTPDYAAVPAEMKAVAAFFGKNVLREVCEDEFYANIAAVREKTGDRAVLRAIHFFDDNRRVDEEKAALEAGNIDGFKDAIIRSGNSSYKYLQNVYSTRKVDQQGLSLALALSEKMLAGKGAWRVHGGGFAGTIQAFIPNDMVAGYKEMIEKVFGEGSCYVLKIRREGGTKVL